MKNPKADFHTITCNHGHYNGNCYTMSMVIEFHLHIITVLAHAFGIYFIYRGCKAMKTTAKFSVIVLWAMLLFVVTNAQNVENVPYTIMIYMNGSDLESEFGLATDDLVEIIDSKLLPTSANLLILTGGTRHWTNNAIPEHECIIWKFHDGNFYELESLGDVSMGNPNTLRDFILFSTKNYPAEKIGLIMWDHGGGSIVGFGHDENFGNDSLLLPDIIHAFDAAGLGLCNKLEFLGFDACLMATVEMAVLASEYARYLIASEDLEPGDGWDYRFLSVLNDNPHMTGAELGVVIVDSFIEFFGEDSNELLALSVIDLENVWHVMHAMGELMERAYADITHAVDFHGNSFKRTKILPNSETFSRASLGFRESLVDIDAALKNFHKLASRRAVTKTFGEGSPRDNYADMVDIGDMALLLMDMYPIEARNVLQALKNCVLYNRHNSDIELHGLSTFYIYGGKTIGQMSLDMYEALEMDERYTLYLQSFFDCLIELRCQNFDAPIIHTEYAALLPMANDMYRMIGLRQEDDFLYGGDWWPHVGDKPAIMFPIGGIKNAEFYAIPAVKNGVEVDIIVARSKIDFLGNSFKRTKMLPDSETFSCAFLGFRGSLICEANAWQILGSRKIINAYQNEHRGRVKIYQKGYDPIATGDEIALHYPQWNLQTNAEHWFLGEVFVVPDVFGVQWRKLEFDYEIGIRYTDACGYKLLEI